MAWMMDEYYWQKGYNEPGVITGKPLPVGGSKGRNDATARGGVYTVREAAKLMGLDVKNATFAIQGFGNAGQFAATLMDEILDAKKLVAVSDSRGGVYNPEGINAQEMVKYKLETGKVEGFPGTKPITNEELLELDVDVLFPSALENCITEKNANNIKAKIIAELANGPTTPEADNILHGKGAYVIPDFLCNAGGVTVSYFEMVQNNTNFYWELPEVLQRLDEKMTNAFHAVHGMREKHKVHNRVAAYLVSIDRVAECMKLRGWV